MVSMALYSAIIVIGISTVVLVGTPILEDMRDARVVDAAKDTLTGLEDQVKAVADAGKGSSTTIGLRFARGDLVFDAATDAITYELETNAEIISPQSSRQLGDLRISSNADVSITDSTVDGQPCWRLENRRISACIRKIPADKSAQIGADTAGYWRFNANRGRSAGDNSSNGNDADINAADWTEGLTGAAVDFDGGAEYAINSSPQGLPTGNSDRALSMWVRFDQYQQHTVFGGYGDDTANENFQIGMDTAGEDRFTVFFWNPAEDWTTNVTASDYADGTWHMLTVTRNGTNESFYVDGVLQDTRSHTANTADDRIVFGTEIDHTDFGENNSVNATIDEVRIWNRSLTGAEVQWLHEQQGMLDYIDTQHLVLRYYNKNEDAELDADFGVTLGEDGQDVGFTNNGTGTVTTDLTGQNLGRGQVTAEIKSFFGIDYTVRFTLLSGADFLQVDVDE
jgi:hypothetical protein